MDRRNFVGSVLSGFMHAALACSIVEFSKGAVQLHISLISHADYHRKLFVEF